MDYLAFLGALLGGMVGNSFVEIVKDRLGANRSWHAERRSIIATVRRTTSALEAFEDLKSRAIGQMAGVFPERAPLYKSCLVSFNASILAISLDKLAGISDSHSDRSAATQYLVRKLLVVHQLMVALQGSVAQMDGSEAEIDREFTDAANDLKTFLAFIYAPKLDLDSLSLVIDSEVMHFERKIGEMKISDANAKLQSAIETHNNRNKDDLA